MKWKRGEYGPRCSCGQPTHMIPDEDEKVWVALCMFHTYEAGAVIDMPPEKPDDFEPYIPEDEEDSDEAESDS